MKPIKTITIALPFDMGREIQQFAKEENQTVNDIIKESFRQYRAHRRFKALVKKGKATAKRKKLTPKDFGGPFED